MLAIAIVFMIGNLAGWAQFNPSNPEEPSLTYRVNVGMTPESIGWYNGDGAYRDGEDVWVNAYSWNSSYVFDYWELDGKEYSREQSFWYKVSTRDVRFIAHFRFAPEDPSDPEAVFKSRVFVNTEPEKAGTVNISSGQRYVVGEEVWLDSYNALASYRFQGWYNGDELVSDQSCFSFVIGEKDVHLTAKYKFDPTAPDDPTSNFPMKCKVDVQTNDEAYGTVSVEGTDNGTVIAGNYVTLHATPVKGCVFEGWSDGNEIVSNKLDWRVLVSGNRHYIAYFHRDQTQEAGNVVSLTTAEGTPGSTLDIDLALFNEDNIAAAEFLIPLGEDLSFVKNSFVPYKANLGSHVASASVVDGQLRVYVFSTDLSPLRKPVDKIGTFQVKLGKNPVVVNVAPDVKLVDASGKVLLSTVKPATVTVLAPQIEVLDTLIDFGHQPIKATYEKALGVRNTGTSTLKVSKVKSNSAQLSVLPSSFVVAAGETKELKLTYKPISHGEMHETITIESDAVNGDQTLSVVADPYSVNILSLGNATIDADADSEISVEVENMEPLTAVQFYVTLPEGVSLIPDSFTPTERSKSLKAFTSQSDGVLKVYLYSDSDARIESGTGSIGTFKVHVKGVWGTMVLQPEDVVLGNAQFSNMVSSVTSSTIIVKSAKMQCAEEDDLGRMSATDASEHRFPVKNEGQLPLVISKVSFSDDNFVISTPLPLTIQPGAESELLVKCVARSMGEYACIMSINSNDASAPVCNVTLKAEVYEPNTLTASAFVPYDSNALALTLSMDHYSKVCGLQFTISGLEDLTASLDSMTLAPGLADFKPVLVPEGNGTLKVLLFSENNTPIPDDCTELFTLVFVSDKAVSHSIGLEVTDIIISNENNANVVSKPSADVSIVWEDPPLPNGLPATSVDDDSECYDLSGRKLKVASHSGVILKRLPNGKFVKVLR